MPCLILTKVRDERSHICCGAAEETRSSIERNLEGLRLLKAFLKLEPDQRSEVIEMVERYATSPAPKLPIVPIQACLKWLKGQYALDFCQ
jgi:hypothetical protein